MLAEAAEPGQILISRQTQGLAAAAIEAESAGPDRFLLRSAHAATRPVALQLDAPLVGRDEEMRRLEAAYGRANRERVTMLVTVTGEAGLGKTRLVHEFVARLGGEASVLTGRCLPYGEGITFWPLREVVRQAGGGDDSPGRIKALLSGEADAAGVAERLSRALGPGDRGRSDAAEIFWAARRLLETLARTRPLLVVFEDLHWAEPTFLDLVESLAVQRERSALVLVFGLHHPTGAAGIAPCLGGRGGQGSFHRSHSTRRRSCHRAAGRAGRRSANLTIHSSAAS